jgi:outer membrane receptor protein involved in Fe transport
MGNGDAYNRAEGPNLPDFTDRWLYDGDYLRLKNITVGYTFDKETITRVGMKNLRLYLSADNVLNSTEYPGGNPEANNSEVENQLTQGVDYAGYPLSRTVTVGLKATF